MAGLARPDTIGTLSLAHCVKDRAWAMIYKLIIASYVIAETEPTHTDF